jgi:hypothetical protein
MQVPYFATILITEWNLRGTDVGSGKVGGQILVCAG